MGIYVQNTPLTIIISTNIFNIEINAWRVKDDTKGNTFLIGIV